MDSSGRFPAPPAPSRGIVRGLPHTWQVDEFGGAIANNPMAQPSRLEAIRSGTVAVKLAPDVPALDLSDAESRGAYWTRATS